ncbi:HET-domain-containing protein [Thozetella sp. PMI_491]|nr:HET-domain-containing protein [Thozetella sp. PMI_491]
MEPLAPGATLQLNDAAYGLPSDTIFEISTASGLGAGVERDVQALPGFQEWVAHRRLASRGATSRPDQQVGLYRPLLDPFEIRVLELEPGNTNDKICGSLHHCSIEFAGDITAVELPYQRFAVPVEDTARPRWYTALSYTWGPPVFDALVEIEGYIKLITSTLYCALRSLRRSDEAVMLWIDQICINQDDNSEKASQIPLMARIYRRAYSTVAWLGDVPRAPSVFQMLDEIYGRLQFVESIESLDDLERYGLPSISSNSWADVWNLLSRPWFRRLWVIQETVLSRHLWLAAGDAICSWDTVTAACLSLETCGLSPLLQVALHAEGPNVCEIVFTMGKMKDYDMGHPSSSRSPFYMLSLLTSTRSSLCYDARDKVYGMLGIMGDISWVTVSYDTTYTAQDLYGDVMLYILKNQRSLLRPVLVSVDYATAPSESLPSWVPDWSQPRQTQPLGYAESTANVYSACGIYDESQYTFVGKELCAQGKTLDTIERLTAVFTQPDISLRNFQEKNHDLKAGMKLASCLEAYPGSAAVFEAFWHCLVAGKDGSGMQKSPSSFEEIFSLLVDELAGRSDSIMGQTYSARQKRPRGKGKLELSNLESRAPKETFQEIRVALAGAMKNRRLGVTRLGYLGLFPMSTEPGDVVSLLAGCHVPFVLRSTVGRGYRLVGECYVHGVMNGEVMKDETDLTSIRIW